MERRHKIALAAVGVLVALLALLWLGRAWLAVQVAQSYFRDHGVASSVEIGDLGLSGVSGRFALGPADAPEISAARIELHFDPLQFLPRVVEVRLVDPVIRARIDDRGRITLPSLQAWLNTLGNQGGTSRWVSEDLAVQLTNLRALLTTPAGALEVDGDVKLVKNLPVSARLRAPPATIAWQGMNVAMTAANLTYDPRDAVLVLKGRVRKDGIEARDATITLETAQPRWSGASASAQSLNLHLTAASAAKDAMQARGADITLDLVQPRWSARSAAAQSLKLHLTAATITAGQTITAPVLQVDAHTPSLAGDSLSADITASASGGLDADAVKPLRAFDPALAKALATNLSRLSATLTGHVARTGQQIVFTPTAPLILRGDKGAMLRLTAPTVIAGADALQTNAQIVLSGSGLPTASLTLRDLTWRDGALTANAAFDTRFNIAMLHNSSVAGAGATAWQSGRFTFTPTSCAHVTLAAFHPGASDLAKDIRASLCPDAQPLFAFDDKGWQFHALAHDAAAILPLGNVKLDQLQGRLAFDGNGGMHGTVTLSDARLTDLTPAPRFKPLGVGGTIALANNVWRGKIALRDPHQTLATVDFHHAMSSGAGSAHIVADKLRFAANGLQPEDISPLLVALKRAEGTAAFDGAIDWTRDALTSHGTLTIDTLDFMTVLGKAHAVKTSVVFTSLLPPVTAPNQEIKVSRIDWTLPFTAIDLGFGFGPDTLRVNAASADWAQGHASLGAFTVKLADLQHVTGGADLKSISLANVISVSNLGAKAKLEGKISGHIPFAVTPEGFRITNGHIAADGPGRLSINRSLWAQGDAAIASNAVQDFAYQALENLAFDQMSADLNSVANGRLQIVFHIKGRSDPPQHQVAEVAITDILNGTALYKPIPLPSGTPIDLTLDTSLNFDELLKSYSLAWSKTLDPGADPTAGAKP